MGTESFPEVKVNNNYSKLLLLNFHLSFEASTPSDTSIFFSALFLDALKCPTEQQN
jgi:hypothetical protein